MTAVQTGVAVVTGAARGIGAATARRLAADGLAVGVLDLDESGALGNSGQLNYSTAKAGLQGFTKTLAIELGKFGVTANAIAPGFIETDNAAPVSVAVNRQMLWRMLGADHPMTAHVLDSRAVQARGQSEDAKEGVAAFLEKRSARFPNRVSTDMPDFYPWWPPKPFRPLGS